MEREKFMQEARMTAHRILEGEENGIMNLVQRAWAEGKRSAEVETLRAAIDEALDRREPKAEPVADAIYPTWWKYMRKIGVIPDEFGNKTLGEMAVYSLMNTYIQSDIAQKLGIEPVEE